MTIKYCSHVKSEHNEPFGCCDICHEEGDKNLSYHVCCNVATYLDFKGLINKNMQKTIELLPSFGKRGLIERILATNELGTKLKRANISEMNQEQIAAWFEDKRKWDAALAGIALELKHNRMELYRLRAVHVICWLMAALGFGWCAYKIVIEWLAGE